MGKWQNYWRNKGHVKKRRVEAYRSIDSSYLYDNRLYPFEEGEEPYMYGCKMKLFSSYGLFALPLQSDYKYQVDVVTTPCNYGGKRHWFKCPIRICNRRCKKLCLCREGIFMCRKCLKLAYSSQNRCRLDRIIDKKWDLIHKLGADSDFILNSQKPKRMHVKTFERIRNEIESLNHQAYMGIAQLTGCSPSQRFLM